MRHRLRRAVTITNQVLFTERPDTTASSTETDCGGRDRLERLRQQRGEVSQSQTLHLRLAPPESETSSGDDEPPTPPQLEQRTGPLVSSVSFCCHACCPYSPCPSPPRPLSARRPPHSHPLHLSPLHPPPLSQCQPHGLSSSHCRNLCCERSCLPRAWSELLTSLHIVAWLGHPLPSTLSCASASLALL
jgi:hypothetical protein